MSFYKQACDHITPVLRTLQWFPVAGELKFKVFSGPARWTCPRPTLQPHVTRSPSCLLSSSHVAFLLIPLWHQVTSHSRAVHELFPLLACPLSLPGTPFAVHLSDSYPPLRAQCNRHFLREAFPVCQAGLTLLSYGLSSCAFPSWHLSGLSLCSYWSDIVV